MQEFDPHVLDEKPVPPPEEFSKRAHVKSLDEYRKMHERALQDPEGFWGEQAKMLDWFEAPKRTLEWNLPHAKWFVGGKLNVSYNCLDRHLEENANKPALLWEAEDGSKLEFTYAELHQRVCRIRQCARVHWRQSGRRGHHLSSHDSRIAHRHAGVRAHRRDALGDFWRI